jgi:hypothetical protein
MSFQDATCMETSRIGWAFSDQRGWGYRVRTIVSVAVVAPQVKRTR